MQCSSKQVLLEILQYSQVQICVGVLIKLQALQQISPKETSTHVLSCEYCKTFTKSFSYRAPSVAAFFCLIK